MIKLLKKITALRNIYFLICRILNYFRIFKLHSEINALYKFIYVLIHDVEESRLLPDYTIAQFDKQWSELPSGRFLLSDPWFRENVHKIISEYELLIKPEWFSSKKVLDAGCGNGRWSYGFSKLGCDLTCVDMSYTALQNTSDAVEHFGNKKKFIRTSLEDLDKHVKRGSFDLVFCWGVLHHCRSFMKSLDNLVKCTKNGGILYLYLYGRDSLPYEMDLELFKKRIIYNFVYDDKQKYNFLLKKAHGDKSRVHNVHDIYAPIINRRFSFSEIKKLLIERGFVDIERTIDHTELFIKAIKGSDKYHHKLSFLSSPSKPYWWELNKKK